jgi:hypothetical protein
VSLDKCVSSHGYLKSQCTTEPGLDAMTEIWDILDERSRRSTELVTAIMKRTRRSKSEITVSI